MPTPSPFVWKTASGQTVDQGFTAEWHPSTVSSAPAPRTFTHRFADDAAGGIPAGFAAAWDIVAGQWRIVDSLSPLGTRVLRSTAPQDNDRHALRWIEAIAQAGEEVDLLFEWKNNYQGTSRVALLGGLVNGSGDSTSETAYHMGLGRSSTYPDGLYFFRKWNAGTGALIHDTPVAWLADRWYLTRVHRNADGSMWMRTWSKNVAEPSSKSDMPGTDTTIATGGWVGLWHQDFAGAAVANDLDVAAISVGFGGAVAPMPTSTLTYFSDYSEFATAAGVPAGYAHQWTSTSATVSIEAVAGAVGGKKLRIVAATQARRNLGVTDVPAFTNGEVRGVVRTSYSGAPGSRSTIAGLSARVSGAVGTENEVSVIFTANGSARTIALVERNAGTIAWTAENGPAWLPDTDYNLALRVQGTTAQAKMWAIGAAEPTSWQLTGTVANVAAGRAGVMTFVAQTVDVDRFAVLVNP